MSTAHLPKTQFTIQEHPHWTIKDAAKRANVHPLTIRRAIRAEKIKVLRFSSQCVRIPHAELMRYEQEARA
jgi:excisionase family DNA binding protein